MTKNGSSIAWHELKTILDRHQRFVLTSHVRADCDALGSELAMAEVLDYLGKDVRIINADAVPPRLAFVDPQHRIELLPDSVPRDLRVPADLGKQVDVIMVLDTCAWGQLGRMADVIRHTSAQVVVIDHHASDGELDAVMFQDTQAEATGRLVADLVGFLGIPWNERLATALFLAIATDTGWFRFSSTKSSTYDVAGQLIDAGACPAGHLSPIVRTRLAQSREIARVWCCRAWRSNATAVWLTPMCWTTISPRPALCGAKPRISSTWRWPLMAPRSRRCSPNILWAPSRSVSAVAMRRWTAVGSPPSSAAVGTRLRRGRRSRVMWSRCARAFSAKCDQPCDLMRDKRLAAPEQMGEIPTGTTTLRGR